MNEEALQRDNRIVEEAARWLEKIERTISREEAQALRAWLKGPGHRDTIIDRCKRWHGPEILAVLGELIPVEKLADRVEKHYGRMVLGIFLGLAGITMMTLVLAISHRMPWSDSLGNPLRAKADISAPVGARKVLPLPDGGSIVLNSGSRVLIDYDPRSRDIALLRGEIAIDAKHDAERPFRVVAGPRSFEVLPGDAKFHLRKVTQERLELTVLQGQLEVAGSRMPHPVPPALLRARVSEGPYVFNANEAGTLGTGWQTVWMPSTQELERRTAWQSGRIVLDREPLEDALLEVERYTTSRFVFAEEDLRSVRMSGVIKAGDITELTRYLRSELGIGARGTPEGTIVLTRLPLPPSTDCPANYSCRRLGNAIPIRFFYGPAETQ